MLVKPNVKTKEGWQIWGKYGLVLYLLGKIFLPDVDTEQVMSSVSEVAAWYRDGGMTSSSMTTYLNQLVDAGIALYFGNSLRKPKPEGDHGSDN